MAIPKYPVILTEAEWSKKKGVIAKMAGETGLGALMKQTKTLFDTVKWDRFDVAKALKGGSTGDEAQVALAEAKVEYKNRVTPLAVKIDELARKAKETETKFKASKAIPSSSTAYVGQVQKAAVLFATQVKAVNGEFKAFENVIAMQTVQDAIGEAWFTQLAQVSFYRNADVVRWTTTKELTLSADDGQVDGELADVLADGHQEIEAFKAALVKLQGLREKRMEKAAAIKQVSTLWRQASDAFFVMKPGLMGIHRAWAVRQNQLAKSKEKMDLWTKAHPAAMALHKKVEKILFDEEPKLNALDEHIDQLAH